MKPSRKSTVVRGNCQPTQLSIRAFVDGMHQRIDILEPFFGGERLVEQLRASASECPSCISRRKVSSIMSCCRLCGGFFSLRDQGEFAHFTS